MDSKHVHLEMIQGIINRLSQNSFMLKGWVVVLVSALFALAAKDSNIQLIYLAWFPALAFWGLDGYFLQQERQYRQLYDHIRMLPEESIDYSMDTTISSIKIDSWWRVTFSKTLLIFHGIIIASIFIVMTALN